MVPTLVSMMGFHQQLPGVVHHSDRNRFFVNIHPDILHVSHRLSSLAEGRSQHADFSPKVKVPLFLLHSLRNGVNGLEPEERPEGSATPKAGRLFIMRQSLIRCDVRLPEACRGSNKTEGRRSNRWRLSARARRRREYPGSQ